MIQVPPPLTRPCHPKRLPRTRMLHQRHPQILPKTATPIPAHPRQTTHHRLTCPSRPLCLRPAPSEPRIGVVRTFVTPGVQSLHQHHGLGLFFLLCLYLLPLRPWGSLYCPLCCILYVSMTLRAYSDETSRLQPLPFSIGARLALGGRCDHAEDTPSNERVPRPGLTFKRIANNIEKEQKKAGETPRRTR